MDETFAALKPGVLGELPLAAQEGEEGGDPPSPLGGTPPPKLMTGEGVRLGAVQRSRGWGDSSLMCAAAAADCVQALAGGRA